MNATMTDPRPNNAATRGINLDNLIAEINRQRTEKRDFLVDVKENMLGVMSDGTQVKLGWVEGDEIKSMPMTEWCGTQISQYLGIPTSYWSKMVKEKPDLASHNANVWVQEQRGNRLVRTLDGRARAFLSDCYRPIDHFPVLEAFMEAMERIGKPVHFLSANVSDQSMYIKVAFPWLEREVKLGDPVRAGFLIRNSETGQGSLYGAFSLWRKVCWNGATIEDNMYSERHVHRGPRMTKGLFHLSGETIEAGARHMVLKIRDAILAAQDEDRFNRLMDSIKESAESTFKPGLAPAVMEISGKEFGLSKNEIVVASNLLLESADWSKWGVINAITGTAHYADSYDRASEIERIGGKLISSDGFSKIIAKAGANV